MPDTATLPSLHSTDRSYDGFRRQQNARGRWRFGMMLVGVMALYLASYIHAGLISLSWPPMTVSGYPLIFSYLMLVGILGAALAPFGKPRSWSHEWVDNAWLLLLLCGGAAFVAQENSPQNLAGYVIICFPAAVLHSAEPRNLVALFGCALILAFIGILYGPSDAGQSTFLYLLTLLIISFTSLYVALSAEATRHTEFLTAFELETANIALHERSLELARANEKLAATNADMQHLNDALAERTEALEQANRNLGLIAMTDPLTGVANRRHLFERLDHEFPRARRYNTQLSLALIDLDDFGRMNKMHGVLAGDEVLSQFATNLRAQVRASDTVARYGGEEFVVLMPNSTLEAATLLMERIRASISQLPLSSKQLAVSFSAGIAAMQESDPDPVMLLHRADEAMRRAKTQGKNRVIAG